MYEVTQSLTETQKLQIADELEKLFTLQDRPFSSRKSAHFIEEFEKTRIPASALISGIRTLMYTENIGNIDFPRIIAVSKSKVDYSHEHSVECDHCSGRGQVMMKDENFYEFSFKCICGNSEKFNHHNLAQWNGESVQLRNGHTFSVSCS